MRVAEIADVTLRFTRLWIKGRTQLRSKVMLLNLRCLNQTNKNIKSNQLVFNYTNSNFVNICMRMNSLYLKLYDKKTKLFCKTQPLTQDDPPLLSTQRASLFTIMICDT